VRKGLITRRKQGRAFVYAAQASRDVLRRAAVRELVDGFFDGSEEQLALYLRGAAAAASPAAAEAESDTRIDTVLL